MSVRRILIDADGCPVVDETIKIAKRFGLECLILCDTSHRIEREGAQTMVFSKGADSGAGRSLFRGAHSIAAGIGKDGCLRDVTQTAVFAVHDFNRDSGSQAKALNKALHRRGAVHNALGVNEVKRQFFLLALQQLGQFSLIFG